MLTVPRRCTPLRGWGQVCTRPAPARTRCVRQRTLGDARCASMLPRLSWLVRLPLAQRRRPAVTSRHFGYSPKTAIRSSEELSPFLPAIDLAFRNVVRKMIRSRISIHSNTASSGCPMETSWSTKGQHRFEWFSPLKLAALVAPHHVPVGGQRYGT